MMEGLSGIRDFAMSYIMQAMWIMGADIDSVLSQLDWSNKYFVGLDVGELDAEAFRSEFPDLDLEVSFGTSSFMEINFGETLDPALPPMPTPDPSKPSIHDSTMI